jgi:chromosome segregation ATPase
VACNDSENADRDAQICSLGQQLSGLKNEKRSADAEICKRKDELIELMSTLTIFETDSECKTTELSSLVEQREDQIGQLERTIAENKLLLQGKDSDIFRLSKLAEGRAEELLQLRELLDVQRTKENQDVQRLVVRPETVEIAVQCQRDQETLTKKMARKEKQLSDRFKTESEFRDQDSTRLLAAKDKEIRRLKTLAETNAELLTLVANLRQQLDLRGFSGDYASVLSKGNLEEINVSSLTTAEQKLPRCQK